MDFDSTTRTLLMVLGIGLVIFVHELGHFLAARLCGVRVETFSLGFGPRLFGWRRGETMYQLALLPIGGFCRMAGEDPASADGAPAPYELRAKSVGQRFFIYSGGVLMNVLFALVAMPLVMFLGVPFSEPVVGEVVRGGPAWHARIEPGARILAINGAPVAAFDFIEPEVALGPQHSTEIVVLDPGASRPRTVQVTPRYNEELGINTIGVRAGADRSGAVAVAPDSAAALAGLSDDDRIVAVRCELPELALDEQLALVTSRGGALELELARAGQPDRTITIEPQVREREKRRMLGVGPLADEVQDLRAGPVLDQLGLRVGDRIVSVNGEWLRRAFDLERALCRSEQGLSMTVERGSKAVELRGPALGRAQALALARDIALRIPKKAVAIYLQPHASVRGVLADGDRILAANGVELNGWDEFLPLVRSAADEDRSLLLEIARRSANGEFEVSALTVSAGPAMDILYGFAQREAYYTYQADGALEALRVGVQANVKFARDTWAMVQRMLLGQVSGKNMGGIISIGVVSYSWSEHGVLKLLFFLCMLSINLAFINVLPIPLLDGGHLFFLIVEKLKGSPVSERVFGYSQVVGLVLILTLLVYVTYNDIMRWSRFLSDS